MPSSIQSPYSKDGLWLKGNLHSHTTGSDGSFEAQELVDIYAELGHDFLMISDHDYICPLDNLDNKGMVLIPGNEVSSGGPHILHINAQATIAPNPDRQKVIDAIHEDGGLVVMNHPNRKISYDDLTLEQLLKWGPYEGIEIVNAHGATAVGDHLAVQKWDRVISNGHKVFAFAHDDSHRKGEHGCAWNVVRAKNKSLASIFEAFKNGNFYCSTGVTITDIQLVNDGNSITIKTLDADRIVVIGPFGQRLEVVDSSELTFTPSPTSEAFFRIECFGKGEDRAWTQPFYVKSQFVIQMQEKVSTAILSTQTVNKGPELNGKFDNALWDKTKSETNFYEMKTGALQNPKTFVKSLIDDSKIYFGFKCLENNIKKLKLNAKDRGSIYSDDSIEVFLDIEGCRSDYLHLCFNAMGSFKIEYREQVIKENVLELKTCIQDDCWTAEVSFDLEMLKSEIGIDFFEKIKDNAFHINICRNRYAESGTIQNSSLIWVGSSYHSPGKFGKLNIYSS